MNWMFLALSIYQMLGFESAPKNSLRPKGDRELEQWIQTYAPVIVICVGAVGFLAFCVVFVGLSATESGMLRNFISGGV